MQNKKVIVLDFDHTLFNTTLYVQALREALRDDGIEPEVFDAKREQLKSCCSVVDIDRFVESLPVADKACLHESIHNLIRTRAKDFVFVDAQEFIDRHRVDYDIALLTQGDKELQSEKVQHSGLTGFHKVVISQNSKDQSIADIAEHYDEIHYVDDKAKHIDEVKNKFPHIKAYFIQRPEDKPYANIPSKCDCADKVVTDLGWTLK